MFLPINPRIPSLKQIQCFIYDALGSNVGVKVDSGNRLAVGMGSSASGGYTPYLANAIKTVVTISSAAGKFAYTDLINVDSVPTYLQVFDTTGAVTLGTTPPTFVIPYPTPTTAANGSADRGMRECGYTIANGIKAAATTTLTGSSTSANGLSGTIGYR